jgi:hypothetical protein
LKQKANSLANFRGSGAGINLNPYQGLKQGNAAKNLPVFIAPEST